MSHPNHDISTTHPPPARIAPHRLRFSFAFSLSSSYFLHPPPTPKTAAGTSNPTTSKSPSRSTPPAASPNNSPTICRATSSAASKRPSPPPGHATSTSRPAWSAPRFLPRSPRPIHRHPTLPERQRQAIHRRSPHHARRHRTDRPRIRSLRPALEPAPPPRVAARILLAGAALLARLSNILATRTTGTRSQRSAPRRTQTARRIAAACGRRRASRQTGRRISSRSCVARRAAANSRKKTACKPSLGRTSKRPK